MSRDRKRDRDRSSRFCGGCKNFKAGSDSAGFCERKEKTRDAGDDACGHYFPR